MPVHLYTRKIQLLIDSPDPAAAAAHYRTLLEWRSTCRKAANLIYSHQFLQEQIRDLVYLSDGARVRLSDCHTDAAGILVTSRRNSTYRLLAARYKKQIPMHIISCLNHTLCAHFSRDRPALVSGEKSISNFRKDLPVPFKPEDLKWKEVSREGHIFHFTLFRIPFRTFLGRDCTDKRALLEGLASQVVRLRSGALTLENGRIFLLAVFEKNLPDRKPDLQVVAEASLSPEYAVTARIGKNRLTIGNREEFFYRRLALQAAIRRKEQAAAQLPSGRRKKLRATLAQLRQAETRYAAHQQHLYSKKLIDFCLLHGAGKLVLTEQSEKEKAARTDPFLLRNWGYYGLKKKIAYKAGRLGIVVISE